jgi:hypothetical protein
MATRPKTAAAAPTVAMLPAPVPALPDLPTVNVERWLGVQGKNVEALTAAGKVLVDAAQLVAKRQAEIAQRHVESLKAEVRDVLNGRVELPAKIELPIAKAQAVIATAQAEAEELQGIVIDAQKAAFEIVRARLLANFDDVRSLAA